MNPQIVNRSSSRVPRRFLEDWVRRLSRALRAEVGVARLRGKELGLVFLDVSEARALNKQYRGKNYATDVLSFDGDDVHMLGELVLCPEVLRRQAKEHGLSYREELGYMIVHGVLHLLGFEHERGGRAARRMFELQDRVFESLCGQIEAARAKRRTGN